MAASLDRFSTSWAVFRVMEHETENRTPHGITSQARTECARSIAAERSLLVKSLTAALVAATILIASGCDMTGVPRVAGTYSGPLSIVAIDAGISGTASMTLTVEQSGTMVTVSGAMTADGITVGIPAMRGTIDATGIFEPTALAGVSAGALDSSYAACGTVSGGWLTLTFAGRTAHWSMAASTSRCGTITYTARLVR